MSLLTNYRGLLQLLDPRERRQYALLTAVSLVMAVLELLGIAIVIPFLALVSKPDLIEANGALRPIAARLQLSGHSEVLVVLAATVFVVVLVSIAGRALVFHLLIRFTRMRALSLTVRLMTLFLRRDYLWHVARDSADLARKALDEVREVVNGPLNASLRFIANSAVLLLIIAMLIALQPVAALAAAGLMVLCYGSAYLLIQRRLKRMGHEWQAGNAYRYRIVNEALGGIREVKLFGLQSFYLQRYYEPAERVARTKARIKTLSEMPRYILEAVAFGGMLLFLILLLVTGDGDIVAVLPILGAYAVAGVRLFPIVQSLYADYATIVTGEALVDSLLLEFTADDAMAPSTPAAPGPPPSFGRSLELRDVSFTYPGADRPALAHCSLTIRRGAIMGIAGTTGAGKSTLIDVLSGLVPPDTGQVLSDDRLLSGDDVHAWRTRVGYVPQSIFLVEDTIARNIAFGVNEEILDMERVRDAARTAQIDDFIVGLPDGYDTRAGERGKRLSGGQRQRVAIARALYRRPDLLILDEATSALDPATEASVMEAITRRSDGAAIVLIAHRLATLRHCEVIHVLDHGRIVASEDYESFVTGSAKEHARRPSKLDPVAR